jgi:hypothetical protein
MSNRRLREKAEKLEIQRENPSLWTGLRKPGQPSKIFNRAEAEAQYKFDFEAEREIARKRAIELEGGASAGQTAPTGQTASRLDASPTPRLDAQNQSPAGASPQRETFAEEDARTRREATLAGKFGEQAQARAQNLEGRKGLFAEMKAGSTDSATARERASSLGVDDKSFNTAVARIEGVDMTPTMSVEEADKVFADAERKYNVGAGAVKGRALAERNIAEKGQAGAAADYFKRAGKEKAAAQQKRNSAFADQSLAAANKMAPEAPMSFASTFGSEIDFGDLPSPAMQQARANTAAARTKADTMRAEYEAGQARASKSPKSSRPTPIPEPTPKPKPKSMEYNEAAVGKVRGVATKVDDAINTELGKVASKYKGAFAQLRKTPGKLNQIVDQTNQASNLFSKYLRSQLGIQ